MIKGPKGAVKTEVQKFRIDKDFFKISKTKALYIFAGIIREFHLWILHESRIIGGH